MALKEQIEHAAAVTKWKADQQMRILKIQGQISDMENTIKGRVYALGESTLRLGELGELKQPSLLELTHEIQVLKEQLQGLEQTLTAVKTENGPQRPQPQQDFSGLVCPVCGVMLRGNFCPEHGVVGVPAPSPEPISPATPSGGYLACTVCNQQLNGKYCPTHGAEGIWVEPNPSANPSPEPWSNPNSEPLPGFRGQDSQPTSWNTYSSVPPVTPPPDQTDTVDHGSL